MLWKRGPDSTWVRGRTDDQGQIMLPVNVREAGDMFLTVTKQNHKPYLATMPCAWRPPRCRCSAPTPSTMTTVGGTSGNSNGRLNPGEIVDLPVFVRNFGTSHRQRHQRRR